MNHKSKNLCSHNAIAAASLFVYLLYFRRQKSHFCLVAHEKGPFWVHRETEPQWETSSRSSIVLFTATPNAICLIGLNSGCEQCSIPSIKMRLLFRDTLTMLWTYLKHNECQYSARYSIACTRIGGFSSEKSVALNAISSTKEKECDREGTRKQMQNSFKWVKRANETKWNELKAGNHAGQKS